MLTNVFQNNFLRKYIKIIYFLFFKIIFCTVKDSKNHKKRIITLENLAGAPDLSWIFPFH
jgi:hypothetical protein